MPGGTVLLHPDDLEPAPQEPLERLVAGRLGLPQEHELLVRAKYLKHAYRHDPLSSLNNARIEPQLHQVFVAHRVTRKLQPRMILADEVGLGKTVEAGLIIKELRARDQVARVLIVSPASLSRQWQAELAGKFNETFEIIDGDAAKYLGKGGKNPFGERDNVICSLPFASSRKRAEQILEVGWDLVIFDEAHRVRRTSAKETEAYKLADELKETVNGLLLLTATPVQLEAFELYSLIQLVEPGLFVNAAAFEKQRMAIPELNALMKTVDGWDSLSDDKRSHALATHRLRLSHAGVTSGAELETDAGRELALERITAQHPYADVMIRNRKTELGLQGRRNAHAELVELSEVEVELYRDVSEYIRIGYNLARTERNSAIGFLMVSYQKMLASSSHALRVSFRRRVDGLQRDRTKAEAQYRSMLDRNGGWDDPSELSDLTESADGLQLAAASHGLEIEQLQGFIARLDQVRDSKLSRTLAICRRVLDADGSSKIVIFTQFIETQNALVNTLTLNGISAEAFNGRLSGELKESAVRRFRHQSSVLVSTEAGGEGRNLQFANHLINYDLPWNPMKVEQRIGRLDRIGQKRPVNIYNLLASGTLEERIFEVLHKRIRVFEESVGALDPILGSIEQDIERLALLDAGTDTAAAFDLFAKDVDERLRQAEALDKRLGDFILDRSSFRRDQLSELQAQTPLAKQSDVEGFCRDALSDLGGLLVEHEAGGEVVKLSSRGAARLGLPADGYHGVFDPQEALRREELDFFAFGHDLVDGLVSAAESIDGADVGCRRSTSVAEGTWLEVVYETRSSVGERRGALIRHLVGPDLEVISEELRRIPQGVAVDVEVPGWVAGAAAASQARFDIDFAAIRQGYLDDYEAVRRALRDRAERLHEYRRNRLELQVERERAWLDEHDVEDAADKYRKIIPARRGKLEADRQRLSNLSDEFEQALSVIASDKPTVEAGIAWVSLVVGG